MEEKQLIKEIERLKEIRPSRDWVFNVKNEILGQKPEYKIDWLSVFTFVPRHKLAFAVLTVIFVIVGVFGFTQNSLPGEFFYPVKKAVEQAQINILSAQTERAGLKLELVNKRLSDVVKIAEAHQAGNLDSAMKEFKSSAIEAAQNLNEIKDPEKVAMEVKKIEESRQNLEALGIIVGETEELDNALAELVEREIKDLESRALSSVQTELIGEAKGYFEAGDYGQALETVLKISQTQ